MAATAAELRAARGETGARRVALGGSERARVRSTRARILGWYVAVLVVTTVVAVGLGREVLIRRAEARVDVSLSAHVEGVRRVASLRDAERDRGGPAGAVDVVAAFTRRTVPARDEGWIAVRDGRIELEAGHVPAAARSEEAIARWSAVDDTARGAIGDGKRSARWLAVPVRGGDDAAPTTFVALGGLDGARREADDAALVVLAASLSVLIGATGAAWAVAGRTLAPVRLVTETARTIGETDLGRRIPDEGDDEVAELARTFNGMLDRLDGAFRAQRHLLDDAGHELRTPITVIRGHLELLGDDAAERREVVGLVTAELDRMARLVDDLLVLARAERPDFVRPQPVHVGALVHDVIIRARALSDRAWHHDGAPDLVVMADPDRVAQALANLAVNADRHTPAGADVWIGAARHRDTIRLWVADSGAGVAPAERERIFDRFTRGTGGGRTGGAGLGLSIVRAIAEAHGGTVEVDERPGGGATFTIVLPCCVPEALWPAS